jgi:general secretion pathway protein L
MPERDIDYAPEVTGGQRPGPAYGVWSLGADGLVLRDASWTGLPVVLVPTEEVRLLGVDLPIANRARRAAALPFVLEDEVSEPIEVLHAALGEALSPGRYMAGIVRHDRMAQWCEVIEAAGLEGAAVVPDALTLPRADFGSWSVAASANRVMVHGHDGSVAVVSTSPASCDACAECSSCGALCNCNPGAGGAYAGECGTATGADHEEQVSINS